VCLRDLHITRLANSDRSDPQCYRTYPRNYSPSMRACIHNIHDTHRHFPRYRWICIAKRRRYNKYEHNEHLTVSATTSKGSRRITWGSRSFPLVNQRWRKWICSVLGCQLYISAMIPRELFIATLTIFGALRVCAKQIGLALPEHCAIDQHHNRGKNCTMPRIR
jgi:hypothetical protein